MEGRLEGRWQIDRASLAPTDLTVDPSNADRLWIVDARSRSILQFDGGESRVADSQAVDAVFALHAADRAPQGIAYYAPPGSVPTPGETAPILASSATLEEDDRPSPIELKPGSDARQTDDPADSPAAPVPAETGVDPARDSRAKVLAEVLEEWQELGGLITSFASPR
jgi:hypothetical protein